MIFRSAFPIEVLLQELLSHRDSILLPDASSPSRTAGSLTVPLHLHKIVAVVHNGAAFYCTGLSSAAARKV